MTQTRSELRSKSSPEMGAVKHMSEKDNQTQAVIQIKGLTYSYGRNEAVRDFNLTVHPGTWYGRFGRNGAGKTPTMKCLLNLLRPQKGTVRLFGLAPAKDEVAVKRRLAY